MSYIIITEIIPTEESVGIEIFHSEFASITEAFSYWGCQEQRHEQNKEIICVVKSGKTDADNIALQNYGKSKNLRGF
jgi:hypothetical protein